MQEGKKPFAGSALILVAFLVLGVLLMLVIKPKLFEPKTISPKTSCINNLRLIEGAKEQWALEYKATSGERVNVTEVNQFLKGGTGPICPQGGRYTYNAVGKKPTSSLAAVRGHSLW